jgi:hypothetical protein
MKDQTDTQTVDLFPAKRGPGRPVTGKAKSNAERQKRYRQNKAAGLVKPASLPSVSEMLDVSELSQLRFQLAEMERDRDRWREIYSSACSELARIGNDRAQLNERVEQLIGQLDQVRIERNEAVRLYLELYNRVEVQAEDKKRNVTENKPESESVLFDRLETNDYARRCQGLNQDKTRCRGKGSRTAVIRLEDGRIGYFCACNKHESDFRPHPSVLRNVTEIPA